MGKHALLSASSSHRWLNCPPSARLCEKYEDAGSEYAQEGTDAHSLCEYKLRQALGMDAADPTENLSFYNEEMEQCATDYAAYVLELVEGAKKNCKDPVVLIEQRLDFSRFVKDGFGTGDCVIIADGTLDIVDYKHGKGVEVSAVENPQMMLYALGALELFDGIYDIDTVRMTIFQPRRENVSVCVMAKDDLLQWAHNDLTYKAKLAYEGGGEFACGDWCRFCKAKAVCRKRAEYNLELAKYDFEMPDTLDDAEIAAILDKADELTAWAADVKEYALRQALSGTEYPGYKVVEGRSNRRYISEEAVADAVSQAGYDPYAKKVLGLTEMQKLLGKKKFDELLGGMIEKPQGKPVLVPLSDKRQPKLKIPFSRLDSSESIRRWNAGELPVALIHPASAGHGLNLQSGGSTLVWFGLTWSLELYQQTNARLWRQGQQSDTVVVQQMKGKFRSIMWRAAMTPSFPLPSGSWYNWRWNAGGQPAGAIAAARFPLS